MTPAVVHVGPDTSGSSVGGMASVIRTLVETAPYPATAVASWWSKGWRLPVGRLARSLRTVMQAPRDTVVHVHMSERGSWVREGAFVVVARLSGKRVALTLHGAELGEWTTGRAARTLVAAVLRTAQVVFVLHEADARLVRALSPTPVTVVANPVAEVPARDAEPTDPGTVLFLGEQSRRKGIDVLTAAWLRVLDHRPEARLVVAGPTIGEGEVSGPNVRNLGPVGPDEARRLLQGAAVVVLPSRAEALPMVLLEAMAEGVPFVASDVAGIPRLAAAGAGLTVRAGDVDGLTDALVRLLVDADLRATLGTAGRLWWEEQGRPEAVHEALRAGYRSVPGTAR
jgi:glycosyltransferase involved in cell wall biosynthesis